MRSSLMSLAGLLAAATLGAASPVGLGVGAPSMTINGGVRRQANQKIRTGTSANSTTSYPNGPGWGIRQVQRMARKKRNVKANRRNHRN